MGGAARALRKPVAPAAVQSQVEAVAVVAVAAAAGHVTVTSRDLRRQQTPPARVDDDTDHHADEQQQLHRQEHHRRRRRRHRRHNDDDESGSSSEEEDSSVFADTLTSPQSVYSDARDDPQDDDGNALNTTAIMVVNGGETLGGSTGRTAATHQAFTIVKHRKVELNPTKIQTAVANGKSFFHFRNTHINNIPIHICI